MEANKIESNKVMLAYFQKIGEIFNVNGFEVVYNYDFGCYDLEFPSREDFLAKKQKIMGMINAIHRMNDFPFSVKLGSVRAFDNKFYVQLGLTN